MQQPSRDNLQQQQLNFELQQRAAELAKQREIEARHESFINRESHRLFPRLLSSSSSSHHAVTPSSSSNAAAQTKIGQGKTAKSASVQEGAVQPRRSRKPTAMHYHNGNGANGKLNTNTNNNKQIANAGHDDATFRRLHGHAAHDDIDNDDYYYRIDRDNDNIRLTDDDIAMVRADDNAGNVDDVGVGSPEEQRTTDLDTVRLLGNLPGTDDAAVAELPNIYQGGHHPPTFNKQTQSYEGLPLHFDSAHQQKRPNQRPYFGSVNNGAVLREMGEDLDATDPWYNDHTINTAWVLNNDDWGLRHYMGKHKIPGYIDEVIGDPSEDYGDYYVAASRPRSGDRRKAGTTADQPPKNVLRDIVKKGVNVTNGFINTINHFIHSKVEEEIEQQQQETAESSSSAAAAPHGNGLAFEFNNPTETEENGTTSGKRSVVVSPRSQRMIRQERPLFEGAITQQQSKDEEENGIDDDPVVIPATDWYGPGLDSIKIDERKEKKRRQRRTGMTQTEDKNPILKKEDKTLPNIAQVEIPDELSVAANADGNYINRLQRAEDPMDHNNQVRPEADYVVKGPYDDDDLKSAADKWDGGTKQRKVLSEQLGYNTYLVKKLQFLLQRQQENAERKRRHLPTKEFEEMWDAIAFQEQQAVPKWEQRRIQVLATGRSDIDDATHSELPEWRTTRRDRYSTNIALPRSDQVIDVADIIASRKEAELQENVEVGDIDAIHQYRIENVDPHVNQKKLNRQMYQHFTMGHDPIKREIMRSPFYNQNGFHSEIASAMLDNALEQTGLGEAIEQNMERSLNIASHGMVGGGRGGSDAKTMLGGGLLGADESDARMPLSMRPPVTVNMSKALDPPRFTRRERRQIQRAFERHRDNEFKAKAMADEFWMKPFSYYISEQGLPRDPKKYMNRIWEQTYLAGKNGIDGQIPGTGDASDLTNTIEDTSAAGNQLNLVGASGSLTNGAFDPFDPKPIYNQRVPKVYAAVKGSYDHEIPWWEFGTPGFSYNHGSRQQWIRAQYRQYAEDAARRRMRAATGDNSSGLQQMGRSIGNFLSSFVASPSTDTQQQHPLASSSFSAVTKKSSAGKEESIDAYRYDKHGRYIEYGEPNFVQSHLHPLFIFTGLLLIALHRFPLASPY